MNEENFITGESVEGEIDLLFGYSVSTLLLAANPTAEHAERMVLRINDTVHQCGNCARWSN